MNRTIRTSALAAVAAIVASTLAGCFGAAPPAETAAPSTPTSEPSPAPTAAAGDESVIAAIVVRPDHLDLQDGSGAVMQTLSYDLTAEEIVSALSVVFGGAPVVEEYPGRCCESRPSTNYRWDQFQVRDDHMGQFADGDQSVWIPDDGPDYVDMNLLVQVAAPEVRGVAITTTPGFEVGDDLEELAAGLGQPYSDGSFAEIAVETGPELGPPEIEGEVNAYSVVVQAPGSESEVQVSAPVNIGVGRV